MSLSSRANLPPPPPPPPNAEHSVSPRRDSLSSDEGVPDYSTLYHGACPGDVTNQDSCETVTLKSNSSSHGWTQMNSESSQDLPGRQGLMTESTKPLHSPHGSSSSINIDSSSASEVSGEVEPARGLFRPIQDHSLFSPVSHPDGSSRSQMSCSSSPPFAPESETCRSPTATSFDFQSGIYSERYLI